MVNPSDPSDSDDELSYSYSSTRTSTADRDDKSGRGESEKNEENESLLAKKETRYVLRLRILVFVALLLAALAVSLTVYFITTKAEGEQFDAAYDGSSEKLLESFEEVIHVKIGAVANFAVTFTEFARDRNLTWPFVTMGDFPQRAISTRALSKSLFLLISPTITTETRSDWNSYAIKEKGWLDEGRAYQKKLNIGQYRRSLQEDEDSPADVIVNFTVPSDGSSPIANDIFVLNDKGLPAIDSSPGPFYPVWQVSPILKNDLVQYNMLDLPAYAPYIKKCLATGDVFLSGVHISEPGGVDSLNLQTYFFSTILSFSLGKEVSYEGDPFSTIYVPVFDTFDDNKSVVGFIFSAIQWSDYFTNVLPPNSQPLTLVLENTCDGSFTYQVKGDEVIYIGGGNLHDSRFSNLVRSATFNGTTQVEASAGIAYSFNQNECVYSVKVYPTSEMYSFYYTSTPVLITVAIVLIFIFTAVMFFVYDRLVERRQNIVMRTALKSSQIVSSLFPRQIRDRLFAEDDHDGPVHGTKTKLKSFLSGDGDGRAGSEAKPIADLFTETTVMFADIVGFTAWSSVREPSQVFSLLEALFRAFDDCASRRRVFKVETVGDCYVAVTGLPDPRKDHALAMVRFARDCLSNMKDLLKELEVTLGPGTGDLKLRVGIHSGPVTAGVLRGDRSRFQLFGDTMNTAARMESSSKPGHVQLSIDTANHLIAAGKESWIQAREDRVHAKGKGILQTYWLVNAGRGLGDCPSTNGESADDLQAQEKAVNAATKEFCASSTEKHQRLVEWNVEILQRLLTQVAARRNCLQEAQKATSVGSNGTPMLPSQGMRRTGATVLDEVCEIITLPDFNAEAVRQQVKPESIVLGTEVLEQLHEYVSGIAALYRGNPFHNFEHASHVTMSVVKLLSRIVAPSDLDFEDGRAASSTLHDHTYGITSDPLTQFACVVSALIHDADHPGVPNMQLIKEHSVLAGYYKSKSIAEQNSVDLCWDMLQDARFQDLRAAIYATESERSRFRQLIVNSVMATDIMDKDLKALRNARWEKAFAAESSPVEISDNQALRDRAAANKNRKATIVIEHLIQASDVAHTMQHWHIYRKWNQRLYEEMYVAYRQGRSDTDPSVNWYKGEIGFFDFYIIPLAQKLKDCGVFGVSSDEYMCYAMENRREWESRGQEIVAEMVEKVQRKYQNVGPVSQLPDSGADLIEI